MRAYDPFDPAVLADPFPWYRELRNEAPLYHVEERDYWVLTRYADVFAAIRDHQTFSSAKGTSPEPGFQLGLIGTDPPKHTRLRRIVQNVFTPRAIERNWGARIQRICDDLVDAALERGTFVDAFECFSLPLPIQVIAEILGVPDGDLVQFKAWSDAMVDGVSQHLDPGVKQRTEQAFAELVRYFTTKAAERRKKPGDDLVTMLCQAGDDERLTDKELVYFCILLLIAGNETTTNLIGNGLMALVDHPREEASLRASPERMMAAVEECLRFGPPTHAFFRQTTREVELHGQTIPADRRVMLNVASANRDDRQFGDGDTFRIDRGDVDHLAFGTGIHFCLGSALARLEVRSLFGTLMRRTKALLPAGTPRIASSIIVRGPVYLPIELVAAG
jgi:cytochrome P450